MNSFYGGKRGFGINLQPNTKNANKEDGLFYTVGSPDDSPETNSIYGAIARGDIKYGDYVILSENSGENKKGDVFRVLNNKASIVGNIVGPQGETGEAGQNIQTGGISYIPQGNNELTLINDDFGYAPDIGCAISGGNNCIRSSTILFDNTALNQNILSNAPGYVSSPPHYNIYRALQQDAAGKDFISVFKGADGLPPAIYVSKKGAANSSIKICKYTGNTLTTSYFLRGNNETFQGFMAILPHFRAEGEPENDPWELILWPFPSGYNCYAFCFQKPGVGFEALPTDAENGYLAPQTSEELQEKGIFNIWQLGATVSSETGYVSNSQWVACGGQLAQCHNNVEHSQTMGRVASWELTGYTVTPAAYSVMANSEKVTPSLVICPNKDTSRSRQFTKYFQHKYTFFDSEAMIYQTTLKAIPQYVYYNENGRMVYEGEPYAVKYINGYTLYADKQFLSYNFQTQQYLPFLSVNANINSGYTLKQLE